MSFNFNWPSTALIKRRAVQLSHCSRALRSSPHHDTQQQQYLPPHITDMSDASLCLWLMRDRSTDALLICALWFQDKAHSPGNTSNSSLQWLLPGSSSGSNCARCRWHTDMKVQLIWPFVAATDLTRVHCISGWLTGRYTGLRERNKHLRRPRRRIGEL
jgi:hypothetical protein